MDDFKELEKILDNPANWEGQAHTSDEETSHRQLAFILAAVYLQQIIVSQGEHLIFRLFELRRLK